MSTASARATATTRPRPTAPPAAIASDDREDPRTRAGCWPAWRSTPAPETLDVGQRRLVGRNGDDPAQVKTIEDIALYAHGTGALPPGVEGGWDAQTVYRD